jgi:HCOMODA/2-hydroxy-3-carboxy-muconic semialdehyde decarboxylase
MCGGRWHLDVFLTSAAPPGYPGDLQSKTLVNPMSEWPQRVKELVRELVIASRILAREGVVDALGHISARHPENAKRYLLSSSRSPELVTEDNIMEFDLDSNPIDQRGRSIFVERSIHGSVYKARPDVNAVCHNHAHQLIPFAATATPIKAVWVMGAAIGDEVPIWDIRDDFPSDDGMLIINDTIGSAMAKRLGACRACLLAGHGAVVAEGSIRRTVAVAISLMTNAELLMQSHMLQLTQARPVRYLGPGEAKAMSELIFSPRALDRMWEYWATRAGFGFGRA